MRIGVPEYVSDLHGADVPLAPGLIPLVAQELGPQMGIEPKTPRQVSLTPCTIGTGKQPSRAGQASGSKQAEEIFIDRSLE
jgi:hypothetical protein